MTLAPEATTVADPADRGGLEIGHRVIATIVQHAADQVPGTLRAARRVAGLEFGETGSTAKVMIGDQLVDVSLELALRYPGSVPALVGRVRAHVASELERITGLRLRAFDVTVSGLYREQVPRLR